MYEAGAAIRPARSLLANVAWIRATSVDDAVRDGRKALSAADSIARQSPNDPTALDVLAAALAENGRFAEAQSVAQRLMEVAQSMGDSAAMRRAAQRLATYRAGRPWRQ